MLREELINLFSIAPYSGAQLVIAEKFADTVLNLTELKKLQEKAARCDRAFKYAPSNEQERLEMNKKIDEWREQAKKWNEFVTDNRDLLTNINELMSLRQYRDDIQTIMEGLEVVEKFNEYEGFHNGEGFAHPRPATPEEVREAIEEVFLGWGTYWNKEGVGLKSGAVLRLKERSDEHT